MNKFLLFTVSHFAVGLAGFGAVVYWLPILTAPPEPTPAEVLAAAKDARFQGEFQRDLADSDALHWGEGSVFIGNRSISLQGKIAPGPAYNLYLSPQFVETEAEFLRLKSEMALVGAVKTFENFIVPVPKHVDPGSYSSVIVWCEAFQQFITAAQYRPLTP